jgi:hypothetical protein
MAEVVPFEKDMVKAYLDLNITSWRKRLGDAEHGGDSVSQQMAICYIDAYQSMRVSLFGELLAHPDIGEPMQEVADEWMGGEKSATIPLPNAGTIGDPNR